MFRSIHHNTDRSFAIFSAGETGSQDEAKFLPILRALLTGGASANTVNNAHRSALTFCQSAAAVKILLEFKADIGALDFGHFTPLMHATSASVVEALVAGKADVSAVDKQGRTTLMHSASLPVQRALLDILSRTPRPAGASAPAPAPTPALQRQNSLELKRSPAPTNPVDIRDRRGRTALMYAVERLTPTTAAEKQKDYTQMVKNLLDAKASLQAADERGWTPLMYAQTPG